MDTKSLLTFLNSRTTPILALLIAADLAFLLFYTQFLSIGSTEADIYFDSQGYLAEILRASSAIFGQNNFGLRVPFVLLHGLNLLLIYLVARDYAKKPVDALFAVVIFMLLPGVNSMALLVSKAGFATLAILLFVYIYKRNRYVSYMILFVGIFFDHSLFLLSFAYLIYAIYEKNRLSIVAGALLALLSLYLYGFDLGGRPRGYFLDIFGVYGAIFSPFMLVFYIYTIYFFAFQYKQRLNLLWFASSVPFLLSILLSIRQYIPLEEYGAYAVIATPLMAISFMNSYRIRLPEQRGVHGFWFRVMFITMFLLTAVSFYNKPIYGFLEHPRRHFAYDFHFTADLAKILKKEGVFEVQSELLEKKLRFYGIKTGGEHYLSKTEPKNYIKKIEFVEFGKPVFVRYLAKR